MTTPQPLSSLVGQGGLELEVAYCVGGVITPPCGVPVSPCRSDPASITPTRSMPRTRPRMARSHTRSSTACINLECGIASKQLAMSVSTTQRRPFQDSSRSTCRASCADRLGRNPKEQSSMSASKIGSSTILTAACTMRSRTAGIDSGRCSAVPGFGMNTRRAGSGRYRRSLNSVTSSSRSRVTPYSSTVAKVTRSMPAAPRLRRTSSHALSNTSLRQTLSNSAWNRLVGSALAARYSACCKARTLSPPTGARVDLAVTALTRFLPQLAHERSSGPSLTAGCVVLRLDRSYGRLRRPPGTPSTSRFHTGYRTTRSTLAPQHASAGEGLPSSRRHLPSVPRPLTPGSPSRLHLQDLHRFHGLRREPPGSALPRYLTTRQASLIATDRLVAPPVGL